MIDALLGREPLDEGEEQYLSALSDLVAVYEDDTFHIEAPDDAAMLAHLIEAKGVSQADLAEQTGIARSTVSEVLSGKRDLTRPQIRKLSRYFSVDAGVFLTLRTREE